MKQMRSRFRVITLLLVCSFVLALSVCVGSILKESGVTLASLPKLPLLGATPSPDPSASPDASPADELTPAPSPSKVPSDETTGLPGTDNSPDPEYNVFGL